MEAGPFICPECGSTECADAVMVDGPFDPSKPWSGVLEHQHCARCRSIIPAHLAERWRNLSVEQAQKMWREIYRAEQLKWRRKSRKTQV
jgi:hypothetical protein